MNWISQIRRLAIYLRDGMACAYCGATVEEGAPLSLDHIVPHSRGGQDIETNLVTCCKKCNSSRGNRDVAVFAEAAAGYLNHGLTGGQIMAHITTCLARPVSLTKAKKLIALRGSCFQVLQNLADVAGLDDDV